jgi:hypothetical protein
MGCNELGTSNSRHKELLKNKLNRDIGWCNIKHASLLTTLMVCYF